MKNTIFLALMLLLLMWIVSCSRYQETSNLLWGEKLCTTRCANCHQADGSGLADLYPPLANSDFLDNNHTNVICLIYQGAKGEMVVNGKTYNQIMPANTDLSPEALAAITTYIYQKIAQQTQTTIIPLEVQQALSECQ